MIHKSEICRLETVVHEADVCVIGAGAAGLFAAVAAARRGAEVIAMHDRPVVGGNASSEIRMVIRGARGLDVNESGLIEELALMNIDRNPTLNYSIWDTVTYELARNEENLELLLNCSCLDAAVEGGRIMSVKGWQTTTQQFHEVRAKIFIDCSGDSILAPLVGAEYRQGHEAREEFGEDIAPEESNDYTMGMSCLFEVRETEREVPFKAPDWARRFTDETIGHRLGKKNPLAFLTTNFWWMELGGMADPIGDTEKLRDELVAIALGVWDYIKNSGHYDAAKWELEWLGFLPGKRESRRYVGDHILTQGDVRSGGHFEDIVAYGGWTLDDHHPAGFETVEPATIHHPAPSPFGIPYRCLYSKNVENLMFAGRNISCTHVAMSSSRVMGTCAVMGQAVGTAAALAVERGMTPRGVYEMYIGELKQQLMEDDCFLPYNKRELSAVMKGAKASVRRAEGSVSDAGVVLDGVDRRDANGDHRLAFGLTEVLEVELPESRTVNRISFILDSDLNRESENLTKVYFKHKDYPMRQFYPLDFERIELPARLLRDFDIEVDAGDGEFRTLAKVRGNCRRLVRLEGKFTVKRVRLVPYATYGAKDALVYSVVLS